MDDMELDQKPVQQPDDPFSGDSAVATEQPAQPEQVAQAEPVTAEAQPQPQFVSAPIPAPAPAAEATAEEKPKWMKILDIVALVCISVAGLLAALFMCLMSVSIADVNFMLKDISDEINKALEIIAEQSTDGSFAGFGDEIYTMFFNVYILMGMLTGIVAGLILGIMLIVKIIKKFAMKKPTALEKTAITSCLFFFAVSVMVLGLANNCVKSPIVSVGTGYGGATLAGLILCGIMFGAYFVCKVVANYKMYLGNKTKLLNGCFNLAWAIIAMVVLAVLSCVPVMLTYSEGGLSLTRGMGFNEIFSGAIGAMMNFGKDIPAEVTEIYETQYGWGALGMVIQIWFIFQTGKSLHGAMRGTVSADKAVKLGSQIWRTVFAVLYLIVCVVLSKDLIEHGYEGYKASLAAPIVILVFSVIGLVIAIVNKILVKEKSDKKEI